VPHPRIFLIRGVAHPPIPQQIDGLRTRLLESSRFRAGFGDRAAEPVLVAPSPGAVLETKPGFMPGFSFVTPEPEASARRASFFQPGASAGG